MEKEFVETAKAKINLTLHVGRTILDQFDPFYRYHPLDSLVVFSELGDRLSAHLTDEPNGAPTLVVSGPFAHQLTANDPSNLILKAFQAVALEAPIPGLKFHLVKNLPVASGLGGGSANAAATLRILKNFTDLSARAWTSIALSIGADVPVCLLQRTARMTGIGETVSAVPGLGQLYAVLVNPNIAVSTADVFTAFDTGVPKETPRPQYHSGTLLERALDGRNDLEPVTQSLVPEIEAVLSALRQTGSCELARMSGSGASCFGLYQTQEHAKSASAQISKAHPDWWCQSTVLGDVE